MLLHYASLVPELGGVTAVRFTSGVCIESIRVFPSSSCPFANAEVIAITKPESFYFDVYLNAQATSASTKEKQKASNALVHTRISYAGGSMQFDLHMGAGYSTRLMVIRGNFQQLSLAMYGTIVSEMPPPPTSYAPQSLPSIDRTPLPDAFDLSNTEDPTILARSLLRLSSPSLRLPETVRATWCGRAGYDEETEPMIDDLSSLLEQSRHWPGDQEADDAFLIDLDQCLQQESQSRALSAVIAELLGNAARSHPLFLSSFLRSLTDHGFAFPSVNLDVSVMRHLARAAANPDVAMYLRATSMENTLATIVNEGTSGAVVTSSARRLLSYIQGWAALSDSMLNTRGNFPAALKFMLESADDQDALGLWLASVSESQSELLLHICRSPTMSDAPPLSTDEAALSHDAFLSYVKTFIGVATVTSVFVWAAREEERDVAERALGIIRLWASCISYDEVLTRILLLPSTLSELERAVEAALPSKLGQMAEDLLRILSARSSSYLSRDFRDVLESLQPLANMSSEDGQIALECIALGDKSLSTTLNEIETKLDLPASPQHLRELLLSLAIIEKELNAASNMDDFLLSSAEDLQYSLANTLIKCASAFAHAFCLYFVADVPPTTAVDQVAELIAGINSSHHLIIRLLPYQSLVRRQMGAITSSVAKVFVCSWSADMFFPDNSLGSAWVQRMRQVCINLLEALCTQEDDDISTIQVLRSLLTSALNFTGDPAVQLSQLVYLLNYIIPSGTTVTETVQQTWSICIIPPVLNELASFLDVIDVESKVHLVRSLAALDRGTIGFAEWFLVNELRRLLALSQTLTKATTEHHVLGFYEHGVHSILQTVWELSCTGDSKVFWTTAITCQETTLDLFAQSLQILTSRRFTSPLLTDIVLAVFPDVKFEEKDLREPFVVALLLNAQLPNLEQEVVARALTAVGDVVKSAGSKELWAVRRELRRTLLRYMDVVNLDVRIDPNFAENLMVVVVWFDNMDALRVHPRFAVLHKRLAEALTPQRASQLDDLLQPGDVTLHDDEMEDPTPKLLTTQVAATMDDLKRMLSSPPQVPCTPQQSGVELGPDILAMVTVSPSALLRSPATSTTGLTKTYSNNSFRQQMQRTPSNTNRMPSMHVDDFQSADSSPAMPTSALFAPNPSYGPDAMSMA